MKIEVTPERDGRVVITILREEEGRPEAALKEGQEARNPEPVVVEPEEVIAKTPEEKEKALAEDPHAWEEIEEAQKAKTFRRFMEK